MSIARVSQPFIEVDVAFYDQTEKSKLLSNRYPINARGALEPLVAQPLKIPTREFLTYFLFHRRGIHDGYGSYEEIRNRIDVAEYYIDTCLRFDGVSVGLPRSGASLPDITEHVGESISLSVISRLFGLNEADWTPLPFLGGPNATPSFDFEIASDGDTIVQVEAKGSAVGNNDLKEGKIPSHKRNILEKKATLSGPDVKDRYPASARYGAVVALDARPGSRAKCWLVDPDPEPWAIEPRALRLLKRMAFLHSWIALISPRSHLSASLATRLSSLLQLRNPFELDGLPLLRGDGKPITYFITSAASAHSTFLNNKSRVVDGPAGGIIVPIRKDLLAFLAIREDLAFLAADQGFEAIMKFDYPSATLTKTIECVLPKSRLADVNHLPNSTDRGNYVSFELEGEIHYSPSGLVFGFLPVESE